MTNKQILFLLPPKTINEATLFYVNILKESFLRAGYLVKDTDNYKDIRNEDNVFVMSARWCVFVKLWAPRAKVFTWFQGIGSEEIFLVKGSYLGKLLWIAAEKFTIKFSMFNFYVSEAMHKYFANNKDPNYFIMPCYNKELNLLAFDIKKYLQPSFVYAGSLDKWQCIHKTLELYTLIEKKLTNASLTILTKNLDEALRLIKHYHIRNFEVKYVSLVDLDIELQKYKYGFLIRENHIINTLSTPTKMSSYIANGVIPIYTDAIDAFNINLDTYESLVKLYNDEPIENWCHSIVEYENSLSPEDMLLNFRKDAMSIFEHYYNTEVYIATLASKLVSLYEV